MRAIAVLMFFVCGSVFLFTGTQVHAGPGEQVVTNAPLNEPSRAFRHRSDRYRDPFVPKSVVRNKAGSSLQGQDVSHQTVKVVGTMSSAQGRWALLEFEDGKRLIVRQGQVISAYSRVVQRITDHGVTLSAIGEKARPQQERTYWLYEEKDFWEPRSGGDS